MNYMDSSQTYTSDMSIANNKSNNFFDSYSDDFSSSIAVIQFNESLINFDNADNELFEETFNMSKDDLINNIHDLFEEGLDVCIDQSKFVSSKISTNTITDILQY